MDLVYTPEIFNQIPFVYRAKGMRFYQNKKLTANNKDFVDLNLIAVEKPPIKRTILSLLDSAFDDVVPNFLLIPHALYFLRYTAVGGRFNFQELSVAFISKPVTCGDDLVYKPPLSNIYGISVCMEHMLPSHYYGNNLQHLLDNSIGYFWQSTFKKIDFLNLWKKYTEDGLVDEFFGMVRACGITTRLISDVFPCFKNVKAFTDEQFNENSFDSTGSQGDAIL